MLATLGVGLSVTLPCHPALAAEPPAPGTVTGEVRYAGGNLHVTFKPGQFAFQSSDLLDWVSQSARAVSLYFGRFPIKSAVLSVEPASGVLINRGSATSGAEPRIRLQLVRTTTPPQLRRDSVLVHEMTHLAMPAVEMRHVWLQEGIATYIEFVARAQAGMISSETLWATFVREMPRGLPDARDPGGLDNSQTPQRRYWGGAVFCLLADIEIRKATSGRLGLVDALRAVQRQGGNLSKVWSIERTLAEADRGTGTNVMRTLYQAHGNRAVTPDLGQLWRELGIGSDRGRIVLDDAAPLAAIRRAIADQPAPPLLVAGPTLVRETQRPLTTAMP